MEGFAVRLEQVQLRSGDALVLYTDGLTEAFNAVGVQWGLDRLTEVIRSNAAETPEKLIQKIVRELTDFTEGSPLADDATLVVCKVT
jgi:sigma-B regulation protein RsbU (phosphoserine phosphatase)